MPAATAPPRRRRRHGNGNHRLLLAGNPDTLQTIDHDAEQRKKMLFNQRKLQRTVVTGCHGNKFHHVQSKCCAVILLPATERSAFDSIERNTFARMFLHFLDNYCGKLTTQNKSYILDVDLN